MRLLGAVEEVAWNYRRGTLIEAASQAVPSRHIFVLLAAGVLVGAGGLLIRKRLGQSVDAESAIWLRSGQMPLLPALAQALLAIVTVGLGTSLGRESPIKQAGGAMASQIAQWGGLSPQERRAIVAFGVGVAAAYIVPVGGALVAVEVLLGSISIRFAIPALLCSGIAILASWLLLPTGPIYRVPEFPLSGSLIAWSFIAGPILGLATIPWLRAIGWAQARRGRRGLSAIGVPTVVLGCLGAVSIVLPQLLGNGKGVVQMAYADGFTISLLFVLPLLKAIASVACLGSGATGGLFTPSMAIGALLGGLFGHVWDRVWPGASMGGCAVIGSCAFLAAASRGPISALVLVLELTRHVDATMVPMLVCVVGAMLVAGQIDSRSMYSIRLERRDDRLEERADQVA
jgi:H+/Cl- antiporter ClcA